MHRKQTVFDKIICAKNHIWYGLTESIKLQLARLNWKEKENPKVSIIIPTRNRWDILKDRAIKSVLTQTYKNWELIIVDDGGDVSMSFNWQWDSRVKFYRIDKQFHYLKTAWCRWCAGPVNALNFALSKVTGDYILRMDDDDELTPHAIQDLLCLMRGRDIELYSGLCKSQGKLLGEPYIYKGKKFGSIQATLMRSYLKCFEYNKDCWRKSWNSMNDVELLVRMIDTGVKTFFTPMAFCSVEPRPGQMEVGWKSQQKEYSERNL